MLSMVLFFLMGRTHQVRCRHAHVEVRVVFVGNGAVLLQKPLSHVEQECLFLCSTHFNSQLSGQLTTLPSQWRTL